MTSRELLISKARRSPCRYRVAVIGLDKKGNVLGTATNRLRFRRHRGSIHAEISLIKRYGNRIKTMVLCRVGSSGELRPISPCPNCLKIIMQRGIRLSILGVKA